MNVHARRKRRQMHASYNNSCQIDDICTDTYLMRLATSQFNFVIPLFSDKICWKVFGAFVKYSRKTIKLLLSVHKILVRCFIFSTANKSNFIVPLKKIRRFLDWKGNVLPERGNVSNLHDFCKSAVHISHVFFSSPVI